MGPVPASQKALKKAGLKIDDLDVIEILMRLLQPKVSAPANASLMTHHM